MSKLAVVAIGGNSLIADEQHQSVQDQYDAVKETSQHIAAMMKHGYNVVVTHGNGPQVGFILRRSEIAHKVEGMHEVPLDSCGADTQGALGYNIQMALRNTLKKHGFDKQTVSIITQTVVDPADPAFKNPSKPIGGYMTKAEAEKRQHEDGWNVVEDAGRGYRRVVPSPYPRQIVEQDAIATLVNAQFVVIAVGGGGIPVMENEQGDLIGVEAVIDKDFASSLLARNLKADLFLISTAVEKVYLNFNKPDQKALDQVTLSELEKYCAEGHFAKGSMLPKIKAIMEFLKHGGQKAIITNPENIERALLGQTGTHILP
jgi:carbamate kinase